MAHLKAVCFIRPTAENLALLKKELRKPKYGEYYICSYRLFSFSPSVFTNVLPKKYLEQLAAADEHEVVHEVQVGLLRSCTSCPSLLKNKKEGCPSFLFFLFLFFLPLLFLLSIFLLIITGIFWRLFRRKLRLLVFEPPSLQLHQIGERSTIRSHCRKNR